MTVDKDRQSNNIYTRFVNRERQRLIKMINAILLWVVCVAIFEKVKITDTTNFLFLYSEVFHNDKTLEALTKIQTSANV